MADRKAVRLVLPQQLWTALLGEMHDREYSLSEALTEAGAAMDPAYGWLDRVPEMGRARIEFSDVPGFVAAAVEAKARRSGLLVSEAWARVVLDWVHAHALERARAA